MARRSKTKTVSEWTIERIMVANEEAGFYFFSDATMRAFRCRVLPEVYEGQGGIFIVISDSNGTDPRTYGVRRFFPENGRVAALLNREWLTTGSFPTAREAKAHARMCADEHEIDRLNRGILG